MFYGLLLLIYGVRVGNASAGFAELRRDGFASVGPVASAPAAAALPSLSAQQCVVHPGTNPIDTDGNVVHAHGAGMYAEKGTLYMIGTSEKEAVNADANNNSSPIVYLSKGINLYSTTPAKDGLCRWTFCGTVATRSQIEASMDPPLPHGVTARVERPKLTKAENGGGCVLRGNTFPAPASRSTPQ